MNAGDTPTATLGEDVSASPLVSIVVCFFDAIEITARCIDRIRRCTSGVSYELILVDDGSEDPGAEGLGDLPRLRFIRSKHNMGFTGAANLGARHAVGEDRSCSTMTPKWSLDGLRPSSTWPGPDPTWVR